MDATGDIPTELAERITQLHEQADRANESFTAAATDADPAAQARYLAEAIDADTQLGLPFNELRRYLTGPAHIAAWKAHTWCVYATERKQETVQYLQDKSVANATDRDR